MKIKSHEIGFDLDGVIADIAEAFIRLACHEYNHCSFRLEDITSFQVEECLNIPPSLVEQIFCAILKDSLGSGLQPMSGAVETITSMAEKATVTIITARSLQQPVTDWLDHFFPARACKKINLVAMGDHDDKGRYIQEHQLQYFVDDRVETCLQLTESGITPIVYNQPWNQGRHGLQTVSSWREIEEKLSF